MKKVTCIITGDWQYITDDRFDKLVAKFGSQKKLAATYISRQGKKLLAAVDGDAVKAAARAEKVGKHKIICIVTGEQMVVSPKRLQKLIKSFGKDEKFVRDHYVSRVAARLQKSMTAKQHDGKAFDDLTIAQRKEINTEISDLAAAGKLPAPAAPKGSVEIAPVKKAPVKKASKPATTVIDKVAQSALDPLRVMDGESLKDRKNRVRRERRALIA